MNDPAYSQLQTEMEVRLNRQLKANGDAFLPAADYIAKWGWKVDARGTVPYPP